MPRLRVEPTSHRVPRVGEFVLKMGGLLVPSARRKNADNIVIYPDEDEFEFDILRGGSTGPVAARVIGPYVRPMVRWLLLRAISSHEGLLGESLDYLRFILRASVGAFFKFVRLTGVSRYRRALPLAPFHVVRIAAAKHEDCGPCVQINVNMARKDGVPADVLRAVVDNRPDDLPEELADTYRFVDRVMRGTYDEGDLREKIRARYGARGNQALSEIALVLSSARAFPVTKRLLGYATSCKQVTVDVG